MVSHRWITGEEQLSLQTTLYATKKKNYIILNSIDNLAKWHLGWKLKKKKKKEFSSSAFEKAVDFISCVYITRGF